MGEVKRVVANLTQMLDSGQREAESRVETMHRLQSYLEEKPKSIIRESLDQLLSRISMEAAKRNWGSAMVVLVAPGGRVSVDVTYGGVNTDSYLMRLKSQGFRITRLDEFSSFIDSLKSKVAEGNLMLAIKFLGANTWSQVSS